VGGRGKRTADSEAERTGAVADALRGIAEAADTGELTHLAATSKIEHYVRDRMARWLTNTLADDSVFVVREWRRVDLAVIKNGDPGSPLLLIEGKAITTSTPATVALRDTQRSYSGTSPHDVRSGQPRR
jgi:hypothetical protein